ncbi:hypothetical protein BCR33DRAFT_713359, partial [Rhizoclosmatium globosum]
MHKSTKTKKTIYKSTLLVTIVTALRPDWKPRAQSDQRDAAIPNRPTIPKMTTAFESIPLISTVSIVRKKMYLMNAHVRIMSQMMMRSPLIKFRNGKTSLKLDLTNCTRRNMSWPIQVMVDKSN